MSSDHVNLCRCNRSADNRHENQYSLSSQSWLRDSATLQLSVGSTLESAPISSHQILLRKGKARKRYEQLALEDTYLHPDNQGDTWQR